MISSLLKKKSVAEFFAGIGLMRLGFDDSGWKTCFANDISVDKQRIYLDNFGEDEFILGDIHDLIPDEIPTTTIATASFPCTDLSLAGARAGLGGKESSAFWGFVKIIEHLSKKNRQPPLILLENVTGFLTSNQGLDFRNALLSINRLGYKIDTVVLDASWFVPQSRQRLFVIGIHQDICLKSNSSLPLTSQVRPKGLVDFIINNSDIHWNLTTVVGPTPSHKRLSDIIEDLPDGHPDWWSLDRVRYFENQMSERHKAIVLENLHKDTWLYATAFRRMRGGKSVAELRTDGIAGCLRTPKGGSARQILARIGKGSINVRLLSARECARLMGVPDSFQLNVPLNQSLFAFGDAVCVPVVQWLVENCINPIID
jgi:DNA (cytosine-5)-methyltransferase 1